MATTKIDLGKQAQANSLTATEVAAGTLTDAEINASASIALSKLAEAVLQADGGQALTADLPAGGFTLTGLASPTADGEAATKGYADSIANGLSWKDTVLLASDADANWTASANAAFAGSTLTLTVLAAGASLGTIDGIEPVSGDRVLMKDMATASAGAAATAAYNGIWEITGGTATSLTMTRVVDMDDAAEFDGSACFVQQGTTNADNGYVQTATVATVNTDSVNFVQFSGGGSVAFGSVTGGTQGSLIFSNGSNLAESALDLQWDSTDERFGVGDAEGDSEAWGVDVADLFVSKTVSGGQVAINAKNNSNTASSETIIEAVVGGTSAGDAYYIAGNQTTNFSWGLDNANSLFKITVGDDMTGRNILDANATGDINLGRSDTSTANNAVDAGLVFTGNDNGKTRISAQSHNAGSTAKDAAISVKTAAGLASTATASKTLTNGMRLGAFYFSGHDETGFTTHKSGIRSHAHGTWASASNTGSDMSFRTTLEGGTSPADRMKIDELGHVNIVTGSDLKIADDGGLFLNATAVTSTAGEINLLDAYAGWTDKEIPNVGVTDLRQYLIAAVPFTGSEHLYLNGVLQEAGDTEDAALAGTITATGTAVVGVGTAFTTDFAAGDILVHTDGTAMGIISSVTDATNMVLYNSWSNSIAGAGYALISSVDQDYAIRGLDVIFATAPTVGVDRIRLSYRVSA